MGLESVVGIWDLNELWPVHTTDFGYESDDHHRVEKEALKYTMPEVSATLTPSATAFNHLSGIQENIQTALDVFSLSISAVMAKMSDVSLSMSNVNAQIAAHDASISAINTKFNNVKTVYDVYVNHLGSVIYAPSGWSCSIQATGFFKIQHSGVVFSDETDVNYVVCPINRSGIWSYVVHFSSNFIVTSLQSGVGPQNTAFYVKVTEV